MEAAEIVRLAEVVVVVVAILDQFCRILLSLVVYQLRSALVEEGVLLVQLAQQGERHPSEPSYQQQAEQVEIVQPRDLGAREAA